MQKMRCEKCGYTRVVEDTYDAEEFTCPKCDTLGEPKKDYIRPVKHVTNDRKPTITETLFRIVGITVLVAHSAVALVICLHALSPDRRHADLELLITAIGVAIGGLLLAMVFFAVHLALNYLRRITFAVSRRSK